MTHMYAEFPHQRHSGCHYHQLRLLAENAENKSNVCSVCACVGDHACAIMAILVKERVVSRVENEHRHVQIGMTCDVGTDLMSK